MNLTLNYIEFDITQNFVKTQKKRYISFFSKSQLFKKRKSLFFSLFRKRRKNSHYDFFLLIFLTYNSCFKF